MFTLEVSPGGHLVENLINKLMPFFMPEIDMPNKKNTSDLRGSTSGNSPLSFTSWDDGNKPDKTKKTNVVAGSEESREAHRAEKKEPNVEGMLPERKVRSDTNSGSPSAGSKEWAQEKVTRDSDTHNQRQIK
jgi:hypothetical protein